MMNTRALTSTENPRDPAEAAPPPQNNNRNRGGDRVPRPPPRGNAAAEPSSRRSTGSRGGGRAPKPTPPPTKTRARKDTTRAPTPAAAATAAKPQTSTHPAPRGGDKVPTSAAPPQHRITRATADEPAALIHLRTAGAATSSHGKARMHRIASTIPVETKA